MCTRQTLLNSKYIAHTSKALRVCTSGRFFWTCSLSKVWEGVCVCAYCILLETYLRQSILPRFGKVNGQPNIQLSLKSDTAKVLAQIVQRHHSPHAFNIRSLSLVAGLISFEEKEKKERGRVVQSPESLSSCSFFSCGTHPWFVRSASVFALIVLRIGTRLAEEWNARGQHRFFSKEPNRASGYGAWCKRPWHNRNPKKCQRSRFCRPFLSRPLGFSRGATCSRSTSRTSVRTSGSFQTTLQRDTKQQHGWPSWPAIMASHHG